MGSDVEAIIHALGSVKSNIDGILRSTEALEFLLTTVDNEMEAHEPDVDLIGRIFTLIARLVDLSPYPFPFLWDFVDRLIDLVRFPVCTVPIATFLRKMFQAQPLRAPELVFEHGLIDHLVALITRPETGEFQIAELFTVLDVVLKHMKPCHMLVLVSDTPLFVPVRILIMTSFQAASPVVLPSILCCLGDLLFTWPGDISDLISDDVLESLIEITTRAEELRPDNCELILRPVLRIWNHCLRFAFARRVNPALVPVLAGYLGNERLFSDIVSLLAVISWFPETGIDPDLYGALVRGFDEYGYAQKQGLLRIFCGLAVQHAADIVEFGDCEKLLANALETVEASDDFYASSFLRALDALLSEENDLADGCAREDMVPFLERIAVEGPAAQNRAAASLAQRILDAFFPDREMPEEPGCFLPDRPLDGE
jgi:hypothetical protein